MSETEKLLKEALPCVIYSVNKWADRARTITQKSFRFPSGSKPTKEQIDETFAKWKEMEELAKNITARIAKREDVVEVPIIWLHEALEAVHDWGAYAGDYFREKHGYDADVQKWKDRLRAAQEGK